MMKIRSWLILLLAASFAVACGSGSSSSEGDNNDDAGEEGIATLSGTVEYGGDELTLDDVQGLQVVVGLIQEWPMSGPPKEFIYIDVPESGFPFDYEINLSYTGDFFLCAFLDMDPMDGVKMNAELDPLDVPDEGEGMATVAEGVNERDFVLLDPDQVDYWWQ